MSIVMVAASVGMVGLLEEWLKPPTLLADIKSPRDECVGGLGSCIVYTNGIETRIGSPFAAERIKSACSLVTFVRPTSDRCDMSCEVRACKSSSWPLAASRWKEVSVRVRNRARRS